MNEKIKELLNQSTYEVMGVPQVDQKQFAKLIIEECCDLIVGHEYDLVPGFKQRMTAFAEVCLIKEHFGLNNE